MYNASLDLGSQYLPSSNHSPNFQFVLGCAKRCKKSEYSSIVRTYRSKGLLHSETFGDHLPPFPEVKENMVGQPKVRSENDLTLRLGFATSAPIVGGLSGRYFTLITGRVKWVLGPKSQ